ncbi:MAG: DUF6242 domain-containing protein [Bacteroidales bacterium]|nr:DUF6242 domain-containing protein [Bacteroidales bacterium]
MNIKKIYLLALTLLGFTFFSCKDDNTTDDLSGYTDALCTEFVLTDNSNIMDDLSEVYFTIDQYGILEDGRMVGQIYNADSLPVGTKVSKLLAEMTFNSPKKVMLYTSAKDSVEYSSTDSIDFSNPVTMKVTAYNNINVKYYTLKVNVHKQVGDSIDWQNFVSEPLSNAGIISSQKAVSFNGNVYWFVVNELNQNLLYTAAADDLKNWNRSTLTISGNPSMNLLSLKVFENAMYMLSENGNLYKSTNASTWNIVNTGKKFVNLIGSYTYSLSEKQFIGLVKDGEKIYFSYSNDGENWANNGEISSTFPISGYTDGAQYSGGTASTVNGLVIVGGRYQNGYLSNYTWAYDGNNWASFKPGPFMGLEGATLVTYENDPRYSNTFWLLIGGKTNLGYTNNIYYSSNKGVSWSLVSEKFTFPSSHQARGFSSVYVDSNFFINLFGGEDKSGQFNQIWRGRLNQLAFTPVE